MFIDKKTVVQDEVLAIGTMHFILNIAQNGYLFEDEQVCWYLLEGTKKNFPFLRKYQGTLQEYKTPTPWRFDLKKLMPQAPISPIPCKKGQNEEQELQLTHRKRAKKRVMPKRHHRARASLMQSADYTAEKVEHRRNFQEKKA